MNEQILSKLAEKLGVAVEALWASLLKQAPIWASIQIITVLVTWAFAIGFFMVAKSIFNKGDDDGYSTHLLASILLFVVSGMFTFIGIALIEKTIPLIIAGFANPEYWALRQLYP